MLGLCYGDEPSLKFAQSVARGLCHTAYRASIDLAREKGPFLCLNRNRFGQGIFIRTLPVDIHKGIQACGIRNSHLVSIAPTGTISLLANNVSSGLEPVFDFSYKRKVLDSDNRKREFELVDFAFRMWCEQKGGGEMLPRHFISARDVAPESHLEMQATLQPCVDNAISKTINVPPDLGFEEFRSLYDLAYHRGLKGCTTFRPNPVTGEVLSVLDAASKAYHCCSINREAD